MALSGGGRFPPRAFASSDKTSRGSTTSEAAAFAGIDDFWTLIALPVVLCEGVLEVSRVSCHSRSSFLGEVDVQAVGFSDVEECIPRFRHVRFLGRDFAFIRALENEPFGLQGPGAGPSLVFRHLGLTMSRFGGL